MDERIQKIQELLLEVAGELEDGDQLQFAHNFDALELPSIVSSVIKYLQPQLTPYEAAVYWHMFGRSVLDTGKQYCRVSTRGLMSGVIKSASGKSDELSITTTRGALSGLEEKGAIQQVGEPNREGTLYKIFLPEEIASCQVIMRQEIQAPTPAPDLHKELDYYNVAENRLRVFERDGYKCHYCEKQLTRFTATLDHIQPVSKGGDNSFENLITACLHCNSRRGSRPVMEAIVAQSETKKDS